MAVWLISVTLVRSAAVIVGCAVFIRGDRGGSIFCIRYWIYPVLALTVFLLGLFYAHHQENRLIEQNVETKAEEEILQTRTLILNQFASLSLFAA